MSGFDRKWDPSAVTNEMAVDSIESKPIHHKKDYTHTCTNDEGNNQEHKVQEHRENQQDH